MTPYKFTNEKKMIYGKEFYRIELTEDCKWGKKGNLGGFIESTANLIEDAWVSENARVYGNARVSGNSKIEKTSDYMTISSLGENGRTITVTFNDKMIVAGCFRGNLNEFKEAVYAKYQGRGNYYPAIDYIEALFDKC